MTKAFNGSPAENDFEFCKTIKYDRFSSSCTVILAEIFNDIRPSLLEDGRSLIRRIRCVITGAIVEDECILQLFAVFENSIKCKNIFNKNVSTHS